MIGQEVAIQCHQEPHAQFVKKENPGRKNQRGSISDVGHGHEGCHDILWHRSSKDLAMFPINAAKETVIDWYHKAKRLNRSRHIRQRLNGGTDLVSMDLKFTAQTVYNFETTEGFSPIKKIPKPGVVNIYCSHNPVFVMVWVAVTEKVKSNLVVVRDGVLISKWTYIRGVGRAGRSHTLG